MTDTRLIAVVDEDRSVRVAFRRFLKSAGFAVETFEGIREFLDRPERHQTGCIIWDGRMPFEGGPAQPHQLIDHGPPTIVVTAGQDPASEQPARPGGAFAVLSKPVEGEVLLEAVRRALRRPS